MSMQQVNLYLPELRPKKEWLTASTVLFSSVGLVLLLILSTVIGQSNLKTFEQQVIDLENQKVVTQEQITKIKSAPRVSDELQLNEKLSELKVAIKSRKKIGRIIQVQNLGNEKGFSLVMDGLARQSSGSLALSRIRFSKGGAVLEMQGQARTPESVPAYLQDLQSEPSFKNVHFGLLSLATTEKASIHDFTLGFQPVYTTSDATEEEVQ